MRSSPSSGRCSAPNETRFAMKMYAGNSAISATMPTLTWYGRVSDRTARLSCTGIVSRFLIQHRTSRSRRSQLRRAARRRYRLCQSQRLEPVVKLVDPVIAARALLAHAEAVAACGVDMCFGFVARRDQRVVESPRGLER